MRLIILGSGGMLGSEVVELARKSLVESISVPRTGRGGMNFTGQDLREHPILRDLKATDLLVNAVGWIPQKSTRSPAVDKKNAFRLNAQLPQRIEQLQDDLGFSWLQVATDCVYSGSKGEYTESSPKDGEGLYSESKIQGEEFCSGALLIRSSIIGQGGPRDKGLLSWYRSQPLDSQVFGYTNHFWNGVTTKAFARLAIGVMQGGVAVPLYQHWLPADITSKANLLRMVRGKVGGAEIVDFQTPVSSNRVLSTDNRKGSDMLWELAGYSAPPTITELLEEYF
jgi:dTDP-4-dehydrorhamnose reductase